MDCSLTILQGTKWTAMDCPLTSLPSHKAAMLELAQWTQWIAMTERPVHLLCIISWVVCGGCPMMCTLQEEASVVAATACAAPKAINVWCGSREMLAANTMPSECC
eukprot:1157684-Pelagomonas_calceolata.AAC.1